MKVDKLIVYRIVPFDSHILIGEYKQPSRKIDKSDFKLRTEEALERHRPKRMPSRDECLFVCFSKENAFEWASIKYRKRVTPYKLLTLEITGDLYWFKADCYNLLGDVFTQERLNNACVDYWKSMTENIDDLVLDKGYEGLFIGDANVIAIEYKNYVKGESCDVE